jgi:hypothetical protein
MAKINRLHLILNVLGYITLLGIIMFIIYWLTSPREGFQEEDNTASQQSANKANKTVKNSNQLSSEEKNIFLIQFLEIRDILYNHFKIGPSEEPKLYSLKIGKDEINITTKNPPNIPKNVDTVKKISTTLEDVNTDFYSRFTKQVGETLADIIGYYEMRKSFFDEINALPINQREKYYEERKNNHDEKNQFNTHSWGYIGALVQKYLQGYPFLFFETGNIQVEKFQNKEERLQPISKSPNEKIEQRFDTLILLDLPDPMNPIENFDPLKHREYEISLINTKQVLKLLKCYLIDKLDDPFNEEIDCDVEKKNERGISIKGYNVFSLSVNK